MNLAMTSSPNDSPVTETSHITTKLDSKLAHSPLNPFASTFATQPLSEYPSMHMKVSTLNPFETPRTRLCFVKETTLNKLGIQVPDVDLQLSTVLGQETIKTQNITGLSVRGVNEKLIYRFQELLPERPYQPEEAKSLELKLPAGGRI
jgi:hypothetical protein